MSTLGDTKSKDLGLSGAMSESGDDDANLLANCEATGVLRVNLAGDQLVWLKWMKDKYFLFSIDQALACLIDYSMAADEATQKFIFTVIRCRRCGRRFEKKAVDLALVPELDGSINRSEGSTSKKTDASNNGGTPEYVFDKRARDLIVKHFGADVSKDNCNPVGGNTAGAGEEAPELTQGEPENNNEEKADVDSDAEATDPWLKKSLALRKRRLQFILSAQKEYDIPSIGKVIRILLDYAQQGRTTRRSSDEEIKRILLQLEESIFVPPRHSTNNVQHQDRGSETEESHGKSTIQPKGHDNTSDNNKEVATPSLEVRRQRAIDVGTWQLQKQFNELT